VDNTYNNWPRIFEGGSQVKYCDFCNESFDVQFVTKYETLTHKKKVLYICEYCNDEHSEYDDAEEMQSITYGDSIYYPSRLL